MKTIETLSGARILVDDEDFSFLVRYRWRLSTAVIYTDMRYAITTSGVVYEDGTPATSVLMHRVIDRTQRGVLVDHANGNPLDNRRQNLRRCTRSQNAMNRRRVNTVSGFKGVVPYRGRTDRWVAQIFVNGTPIYLGVHGCRIAAAEAYDRAATEHFGEFAATNRTLGRF